jgi:hypothetical protein
MTFDAQYFFVTLHEKHITVSAIDWVSIAILLLASALRWIKGEISLDALASDI